MSEQTDPVALGASAIKALSHPLRARVVWHFARVETARTSDLAAALDIAPNKASYHLSLLEEHGIITRTDPPAGSTDGRETWWRMTSPQGISWDRRDPAVDRVADDLDRVLAQVRNARAAAAQVNADRKLPQLSAIVPVPLTHAEAQAFRDRLQALTDELFDLRAQRVGSDFAPDIEYDVQVDFLPVWAADTP